MKHVANAETRRRAIRALQEQNARIEDAIATCDHCDTVLRAALREEYERNAARIRGIELMDVGHGYAAPPRREITHWSEKLKGVLGATE